MSCSSPLLRVSWDIYKTKQLVLPVELHGKPINEGVLFGFSKKPLLMKYFDLADIQQIRCSRCIDCRLNYSRVWAERLVLEASLYKHNYFVTLTYNERFLPSGEFLDYDGVVKENSLCLDHVQKFIKRLRLSCSEHFNHTGVRVFYCGEYGDMTDRAHYHLILLNMPDLSVYFRFLKKSGDLIHYTSDFIGDCWTEPYSKLSYGFHSICDVSYDTCAYTAKYVLKKQKGESIKNFNAFDDSVFPKRVQPFCHMSNRPGIAREYYEAHKDEIYAYDSIVYTSDFKAYSSKPPRYFDKLYDLDNPEALEEIKKDRIQSSIHKYYVEREAQASESEAERLARIEGVKERQVKKRARGSGGL